MLDADWNEQVAIFTTLLRTLAADVIGPHGGPGQGFQVVPIGIGTIVPDDLLITLGHYYVDGILCVLEATPVAVTGFPQDNPRQVTVATWTVDGTPFLTGQYVAFGTADPSAAPVLTTRIATLDYPSRTLTMDVDLGNVQQTQGLVLRRITTYRSQPD